MFIIAFFNTIPLSATWLSQFKGSEYDGYDAVNELEWNEMSQQKRHALSGNYVLISQSAISLLINWINFLFFFVTYEIQKLRRSKNFRLKQSISESIKWFISIGPNLVFRHQHQIQENSSIVEQHAPVEQDYYFGTWTLDSMKHSKAISLRSSNYLLMRNCNCMSNTYCCNFGASGRVNYSKFCCACRFTFISALFG